VGPVWPICAANSELLFAVAVDQLCAARLLRPQDLKTRMAAFGSNTVFAARLSVISVATEGWKWVFWRIIPVSQQPG
jgi:hypothetical protein